MTIINTHLNGREIIAILTKGNLNCIKMNEGSALNSLDELVDG